MCKCSKFGLLLSANAKYKYSRYLICIPTPGSWLLVSIADWSKKPLRGFTVSRMSPTGGRDVTLDTRDCGISTTSQTSHVCKHRFYVIPIDKVLLVESHIGLLWGVSAYLATGCAISAKYPSQYCENPAQAWFPRQLAAVFTDLNKNLSGSFVINYDICICLGSQTKTQRDTDVLLDNQCIL